MLISDTIPNLIGGVSQQPNGLRLSSQAQDQVNCYPTVVDGLKKRPPSSFVSRLEGNADPDSFVHTIQRDRDERYIVLVSSRSIRAFTLNGHERTVHTPDGVEYLDDISEGFDFVTIADYTFVTNKSVKVEMEPTLSPEPPPQGLVFVTQGGYFITYEIYLDDTLAAKFTTPSSVEPAVSWLTNTNVICGALAHHQGLPGQEGSIDQLEGWWVYNYGSVLTLGRDDGANFTLRVADGLGGSGMRGIKGEVQRFSDLPSTGVPDGFRVSVRGDVSSSFDNYYLIYSTESAADAGAGVWAETLKGGERYRLEKSTMPHVLVRNPDGSFTFKQADWAEREVGDEKSAPQPSFVGRRIAGLFLYRNRLGAIADENVVMSRAGEFFNFWPTTATAILDSDPVDVAVSHNKVSTLRHAVPFNEALYLFSDETQFVVDGGDILTPQTISINQTTEYSVDPRISPVGIGRNMYFTVSRGEYTGLMEYSVMDQLEGVRAIDVTAHVPKYVPNNLKRMVASTNNEVLVLLSNDDPTALFVYKFYYTDTEKLQSSWGRWVFEGPGQEGMRIVDMDFIGSNLVLVTKRDDGLHIEKIPVDLGGAQATRETAYMDRKFVAAVSWYEPEHKRTAFEAPYDLPENAKITGAVVASLSDRFPPGQVIEGTRAEHPDTRLFYVQGDLSAANIQWGFPYETLYEFSQIRIREEALGGGLATVNSGRFQLNNISLAFFESGLFDVEVHPEARDEPYVYRYTGRTLGVSRIGEFGVGSGSMRVPIRAKNDAVRIIVRSCAPAPLALLACEWEGRYNDRAQRLRGMR